MSNINNNLNIRRPVANPTIEDRGTTRESWGQCDAKQQKAQEAFEKALNCVESNIARRGRNKRDWDAPCIKMDAVAVAHGAFWDRIKGSFRFPMNHQEKVNRLDRAKPFFYFSGNQSSLRQLSREKGHTSGNTERDKWVCFAALTRAFR